MPSPQNPFTEDYFLRGKESGLSNYENYSWKRDLTCFCVSRMMLYLGAPTGSVVLDYGCARGYYVKALAILGYHSFGYDISEWAIENADEDVKWRVNTVIDATRNYDYVLCKDVLEHIPNPAGNIEAIIRLAGKAALIIVPLADDWVGQPIARIPKFVAPQDNEDKTHVNCWSLEAWLEIIQHVIDKKGFQATVAGGFKLPGVKEACDPYPKSVAFITIKKI